MAPLYHGEPFSYFFIIGTYFFFTLTAKKTAIICVTARKRKAHAFQRELMEKDKREDKV